MYFLHLKNAPPDDILQKYSFDSFHSAKYAIEAQSFYEDLSLRGDAAIVEYLRKYSHSEYTEDTICVDPNKILEAKHKLNDKVIKAFSRAIENITKYQKHIIVNLLESLTIISLRAKKNFYFIQVF